MSSKIFVSVIMLFNSSISNLVVFCSFSFLIDILYLIWRCHHIFISLNMASFSPLNMFAMALWTPFCSMWHLVLLTDGLCAAFSQRLGHRYILLFLATLGTGPNPHPFWGLLFPFVCLFACWLDYFCDVYPALSPPIVASVVVLGGAVWVCTQSPWADSGVWQDPFVSFPDHTHLLNFTNF